MSSNTHRDPNVDDGNLIILFDGVCNLCNGWVNFVIDRDPAGRFRFAALQSEAGRKVLDSLPGDLPDSIVLVEGNNVFLRSAAIFRILQHLEGGWSALTVFRIVPRGILDGVYNRIAHRRYRWFGRRDTCRVPTPDLQSRFL